MAQLVITSHHRFRGLAPDCLSDLWCGQHDGEQFYCLRGWWWTTLDLELQWLLLATTWDHYWSSSHTLCPLVQTLWIWLVDHDQLLKTWCCKSSIKCSHVCGTTSVTTFCISSPLGTQIEEWCSIVHSRFHEDSCYNNIFTCKNILKLQKSEKWND